MTGTRNPIHCHIGSCQRHGHCMYTPCQASSYNFIEPPIAFEMKTHGKDHSAGHAVQREAYRLVLPPDAPQWPKGYREAQFGPVVFNVPYLSYWASKPLGQGYDPCDEWEIQP